MSAHRQSICVEIMHSEETGCSQGYRDHPQGLSWLGTASTRAIFMGHVLSALFCSTGFALCYAYDVYRFVSVCSLIFIVCNPIGRDYIL